MSSYTLELPKSIASPLLAEALRQCTSTIVEQFRAKEAGGSELGRDLPRVLEEMASALESSQAEVKLQDDEADPASVVRQIVVVQRLLGEGARLRPIVLRQISGQLGRDLTLNEIASLNAATDAAVARAVLASMERDARQQGAETEARDKFVSFLSHEVRGGLNGLLLTAEVMRRELMNQPQCASALEELELIRRSIMETVETMNRASQSELLRRGKMQPKPAPIDFHSLGVDLAAQFGDRAKQRGVELAGNLNPDCSVEADPQLLLMVMQNLVGNAVKFSEQGTVRVEATRAENGTVCRLSVSDQGRGIPPERLAELFAPLADVPRFGKGGLGLGLMVARRATEMMGARLWADSAVGRGSTFYLDLPMKK